MPTGPIVALLALVVYGGLAVWLYLPIWRDPANLTQCGCGDEALSSWYLGWVPYALIHGHNPLVTNWLNTPDGINVMWNTSQVLPSALVGPVTRSAGPVLSYNILETAGVALSGWTAFLAARRWVRWVPAAFCAGLLYGFGPYMIGQGLGHLNFVLAFVPPLILLVLDDLLVRQKHGPIRNGVLLGLLVVVQLLTGEELLASAAVLGVLGLIVLVLLNPRGVRPRLRRALAGLGVAAVVGGALAAWPLWVQFAGPQRVTTGAVQNMERFGADILSPVVPTSLQHFSTAGARATSAGFTGNRTENGGYLGVPLLVVLLVIMAACWRTRVVRFAGVMLLVAFALSLGLHLHVNGRVTGIPLPTSLLRHVPPADSVTPARLALYVDLFAGLLLAVGLDRLYGWSSRRGLLPRVVPVLAAAVALAPLVPPGTYRAHDAAIPAYFTSAQVRRIPEGTAAFVIPPASRVDSRPMLWQAAAGMRFKAPGGYVIVPGPDGRADFDRSGSATAGLLSRMASNGLLPPLSADTLKLVLNDLRRWDARTVILLPDDHQDVQATLLRCVIGADPQMQAGGTLVWYGVDPARLSDTPGRLC